MQLKWIDVVIVWWINCINLIALFLLKAELDRFQDTARMLKDYYKCMTNPVPEDVLREYPRLPLIDVGYFESIFRIWFDFF